MRKITLVKTIMDDPFNKALFSVSPALSGHGTAHYIVVQVKNDEGNYFVMGHPCDSNGTIKNKEWFFVQKFDGDEDSFITALHNLVLEVKESDQLKTYKEEE